MQFRRAAISLLFLGCTTIVAKPLTVAALTFAEVTKNSYAIVQGTIEPGSRRVEVKDGVPSTCMSLVIMKLLKGNLSSRVELCFLGGTINQATLAVPGQIIPDEGKEGFFFLHDPARGYVQPLVGWSQGLFYLERSGTQEAVTSALGNRIESISVDGSGGGSLDSSVAAGVQIQNDRNKPGISADSFISLIQKALISP